VAAGLSQNIFQLRELLIDARHQQMPEAGLTVEGHVLDPDRFRHDALAVVRNALPRMLIEHEAMVLDGGKHAVPRWMVERLQPVGVGRDERQENAAAQARLRDELDILDRFVEVIGQDQSNPGASNWILGAEILQPAIVRTDAGLASLIIFRLRRMRGDDTLAIERRHRVGERHFADDSLAVLILVADAVIPVAHLLGAVMLLRRVLVPAAPFVKRLAPLGIKVFAIPGMTGARVSVCGDEYVRFLAHWTSPRPGQSSPSFGHSVTMLRAIVHSKSNH